VHDYTVTMEQLPDGGLVSTRRTLDVMARAVRGELPPEFLGYQSEPIRQIADHVCSDSQSHEAEIMALLFCS
jgi:hypothetical protein